MIYPHKSVWIEAWEYSGPQILLNTSIGWSSLSPRARYRGSWVSYPWSSNHHHVQNTIWNTIDTSEIETTMPIDNRTTRFVRIPFITAQAPSDNMLNNLKATSVVLHKHCGRGGNREDQFYHKVDSEMYQVTNWQDAFFALTALRIQSKLTSCHDCDLLQPSSTHSRVLSIIPEPTRSIPEPHTYSNSEHPFLITLDHSWPDQAQPDHLYLSLISSSSLSLASSHMLPLPLSRSLRLTLLVLYLRQPYTT